MGSSQIVSSDFILNRWMKRLPTQVQASLKTVPSTTPTQELLKIADNVHEVFRGQHFSINAVNSSSNNTMLHDLAAQNARLETEIFEIRRMLTNLNVNKNDNNDRSESRSRSFNNYRNDNRNRSRSRTPGNNRLCWYHEKYGNRANKCIKPCSFSYRSSN